MPVPGPATDAVAQAVSRLFRVDLGPDVTSLLTYGRGLDTTRMRTALGLEPAYTTRVAFAVYVRARRLAGPVQAAVLDAATSRCSRSRGGIDAPRLAGAGAGLAGAHREGG